MALLTLVFDLAKALALALAPPPLAILVDLTDGLLLSTKTMPWDPRPKFNGGGEDGRRLPLLDLRPASPPTCIERAFLVAALAAALALIIQTVKSSSTLTSAVALAAVSVLALSTSPVLRK